MKEVKEQEVREMEQGPASVERYYHGPGGWCYKVRVAVDEIVARKVLYPWPGCEDHRMDVWIAEIREGKWGRTYHERWYHKYMGYDSGENALAPRTNEELCQFRDQLWPRVTALEEDDPDVRDVVNEIIDYLIPEGPEGEWVRQFRGN